MSDAQAELEELEGEIFRLYSPAQKMIEEKLSELKSSILSPLSFIGYNDATHSHLTSSEDQATLTTSEPSSLDQTTITYTSLFCLVAFILYSLVANLLSYSKSRQPAKYQFQV